MENGELKIVEKKVTSLVPTTEGSQLQVEEGNANYANFRECVFLKFAEFAEFAVEKRERG